jgi:hypothetical protein
MDQLESDPRSALKQPLPRDRGQAAARLERSGLRRLRHYVIETANRSCSVPNGWKPRDSRSIKVEVSRVVSRSSDAGPAQRRRISSSSHTRSIVRVHAIGTSPRRASGVAHRRSQHEERSRRRHGAGAQGEPRRTRIKRALKNYGKPLGSRALREGRERREEREGVGASTFAQDLIGELQALECNGESLRNWMDSRNGDIGSLHEEDARMVNQAYEAKRAAALEQYYEQGIAAAEDLASVNMKFISAQKAGLDQLAIRRLHQKAESRKEWLQQQRSRAGNQ